MIFARSEFSCCTSRRSSSVWNLSCESCAKGTLRQFGDWAGLPGGSKTDVAVRSPCLDKPLDANDGVVRVGRPAYRMACRRGAQHQELVANAHLGGLFFLFSYELGMFAPAHLAVLFIEVGPDDRDREREHNQPPEHRDGCDDLRSRTAIRPGRMRGAWRCAYTRGSPTQPGRATPQPSLAGVSGGATCLTQRRRRVYIAVAHGGHCHDTPPHRGEDRFERRVGAIRPRILSA